MKEAEKEIDFDFTNQTLSDSMNGGYFQSSFARLMALQNTNQCKSLDSTFLRDNFHESETVCDYMPGCDPIFANISKSANVSSAKLYAESFKNRTLTSNKNNDQVWQDRRNEMNSVPAVETKDQMAVEEEILRLKAECQSLTEENKKLHLLSLQNSNLSHLQSQLESLQWQLKQTESSRQMYRAVMEQVSKFLERVHKNLDIISSRMSTSPKTKTSRFPRSRSVHTMAGMCASSNGGSSRCSSPSPTHFSSTLVSNSTRLSNDSSTLEQVDDLNTSSPQDSLESTFKEYTWKPSRPAPEHVTLEKLSQESFRFYRTVQSLLNTREPDIIHRLTPAVSEVTLPDSNEKIDNNSVGSCISLFQAGSQGNRKSVDMSSCSTQFTMPEELESVPIKNDSPSTKPACVAEDESGFSSMSSFQDVNILPEMKTYPKLGLPIINCEEPKHRRWTSTPVEKMYDSNVSINFCSSNEILPVLWV